MPLEFKKVEAATPPPPAYFFEEQIGRDLFDYRNDETLENVFQGTINYLFMLSVVIIIIFIVISGIKFLTAAGDKSKLEEAKSSIKYAIIALIIVASLTTLVNFATDLFGGGVSNVRNFDPLPPTTP